MKASLGKNILTLSKAIIQFACDKLFSCPGKILDIK